MKKYLLAAAALVLCSFPASADIVVEDILVIQSAPTPLGTNIRINLRNDGGDWQRFNKVQLLARGDASQPWVVMKTWDRPISLEPDHRLSFDFLPGGRGQLHEYLKMPSYEMKAIVSGPQGELATFEDRHLAGDDL